MDSSEQIAKLADADPELAEILKHMPIPQVADLTIPARRQMAQAYDTAFTAAMPVVPDVEESQIAIPMRDGSTSQSLLIKPSTPPTSSRPLILLYYGGGFVLGTPYSQIVYARVFAHLFDAVVICANYRLAPEHPFPTGPGDAWDALKWAAANGPSLGADLSAGFVVGGASAGANLAAVVAQLAKDEGLQPALTGQWSCVPLLLQDAIVPEKYKAEFFSHEQCAHAPMFDKAEMDRIRDAYRYDERSPLFSPVNSPSGLEGLPKTYVQACGMDPLRDDALVYEKMLRESGVETLLHVYPGVPHGVWLFFPTLKVSQRLVYDIVEGMGWLLGKQVDAAETEKVMKLPQKVT